MKDTLLFAEGFIGAAGSMVSETAIGAVDLTQIIGIASLFVGPAAVGKMAKGTKLGAKAAEMIQLAKNSTKARIFANVEKWSSKVDNILAKSDDVIKRFTKNLLKKELPFSVGSEVLAGVGRVGHQPTVGEVIQYFKDKARDVYSKLSSSRGGFSWTLRGENVEIPNIFLKEIEYAKRELEKNIKN